MEIKLTVGQMELASLFQHNHFASDHLIANMDGFARVQISIGIETRRGSIMTKTLWCAKIRHRATILPRDMARVKNLNWPNGEGRWS